MKVSHSLSINFYILQLKEVYILVGSIYLNTIQINVYLLSLWVWLASVSECVQGKSRFVSMLKIPTDSRPRLDSDSDGHRSQALQMCFVEQNLLYIFHKNFNIFPFFSSFFVAKIVFLNNKW